MNRKVLDTRFINSAKWPTTPPALQKAYLSFRLKRSIDQPSLFAGLFTGVREMLSGAPDLPATEPELTEALLSLCAHDRITSWVVAHHSPNLFKLLSHLDALNRARHRPARPPTPPSDLPVLESSNSDPYFTSWTSEIELGYHYALVCHALLSSPSPWPTAARLIEKHDLDIHTTSLCFGTSILGFAIQKASPDTLRALLDAHPLTKHQARCGPVVASAKDKGALERHSVYDVLAMATRRTDLATVQETLTLVYEHLSRRGFLTRSTDADYLFVKAVAAGCTPLVDFLIEKVDLYIYGPLYVDVMESWIHDAAPTLCSRCFSGFRPFEVHLMTEWPKWSRRLMRERVEELRRSQEAILGRMEREMTLREAVGA